MSDIVKKLRLLSEDESIRGLGVRHLLIDASDEIERLQERIEELEERLDKAGDMLMGDDL